MSSARFVRSFSRAARRRLFTGACLSIAMLGLPLTERGSAQTTSQSVRVVAIAAGDANTDFEVIFDGPVCAGRTPATSAFAIRSRSTNHPLLFSLVTAAFMSNLLVRVQTSDDASCHITSLELRR